MLHDWEIRTKNRGRVEEREAWGFGLGGLSRR